MGSRAPWTILLAACLAPACFYDSMNAATADPATGAPATTGDPPATATTTTADDGTSSGPAVTTTAVDPSSPGETGTSTTAPDATTTSASSTTDDLLECGATTVKIVHKASKAGLTPPMQLEELLKDGPYAYSLVADEGAVSFDIGVPCSATYHLWGRVLDFQPGPGDNLDPDSFHVAVDDADEFVWSYGCTSGAVDTPQTWQRIQLADDLNCLATSPFAVDLSQGQHTLRLRNREAGEQNHFAAVARVLLTTDPTYIPVDD